MAGWTPRCLHLERAAEERPDDVEIRIALTHARLEAAHHHLNEARRYLAAGSLERAEAELGRALELDPTNRYAAETLAEATKRLETRPRSGASRRGAPFETLISLEFEDTSLGAVLETLAELAGVNILFDEAYRDERVSVKLEGVSFIEAIDLLTRTHGLFYRLASSRTVEVGRGIRD